MEVIFSQQEHKRQVFALFKLTIDFMELVLLMVKQWPLICIKRPVCGVWWAGWGGVSCFSYLCNEPSSSLYGDFESKQSIRRAKWYYNNRDLEVLLSSLDKHASVLIWGWGVWNKHLKFEIMQVKWQRLKERFCPQVNEFEIFNRFIAVTDRMIRSGLQKYL